MFNNKFKNSTRIIIFLLFYIRVTVSYLLATSSGNDSKLCGDWIENVNQPLPAENCAYDQINVSLKCIGDINTSSLTSFSERLNVSDLYLCGLQTSLFDPTEVLIWMPNLKSLTIVNSNLTEISNVFPTSNYLETINITFTSLSTLNISIVKFVHNLKILDLRFNKLKYLEAPLILPGKLTELYLGGNSWNCSRSLKWLPDIEKIYVLTDRNVMNCSDPKYQGRNLVTVAYYKKVVKMNCRSNLELRNCSCTVQYIIRSDDGKSLTPMYAVNCSHLNFHKFPSYLPENTTIFYGNNNNISDIRPLRDNVRYRNVIDMYLDDNNITSIDVLEAGYWLSNFRVLSLQRNRLQKLPVYALDNALENNANAVKLQLSENPWACDCKFTMRFREILMKYHTIIKDSSNVSCNLTNEDGVIIPAKMLSIERIDVCKLATKDNTLPLLLLNCFLATLICFILIKLGYDYYHYKNYGRLPWIVTKFP